MLKFLASDTGDDHRHLVGIGLEPANIDLMQSGKPIRIDLAAPAPAGLGLPGAPIITLFFGETLPKMLEALQDAGIELPLPPLDTDPEHP